MSQCASSVFDTELQMNFMRTLSNENSRQSWPRDQLTTNILTLCSMFVVNLSSTLSMSLRLNDWADVQLFTVAATLRHISLSYRKISKSARTARPADQGLSVLPTLCDWCLFQSGQIKSFCWRLFSHDFSLFQSLLVRCKTGFMREPEVLPMNTSKLQASCLMGGKLG